MKACYSATLGTFLCFFCFWSMGPSCSQLWQHGVQQALVCM